MTSGNSETRWRTPGPPRLERGARGNIGAIGHGGAQHPDPFAVNPIRRSAALVAASAAVFFGPLLVGGSDASGAMLAGGWVGVMGLALGVPVLALSLVEAGWERLRDRLRPSVDQLDLPPRLIHLLRRHGYDSIAVVERSPDAALLMLSNMDARGLREVRRAVSLWKYRRWQEQGFPATGYD